MQVIRAENVNDAYVMGMRLIAKHGVEQPSRAGTVWVCPFPVMTEYMEPARRVLFDAKRDANPFFHLMESLWMLAGRRDAKWLDQFVKDFSSRFSEGGIQHGAYGYRWRNHFEDHDDEDEYSKIDQLATVIDLLRANPDDRRVVIQMWDAETDLGASKKDIPCNLLIMPRIVFGKLDITVVCRSNDIIWGCYGANAVHFSVLHEYLAAKIGVQMGCYYQLSNNFHAYATEFEKRYTPQVVGTTFPLPAPYDAIGEELCNVTPIVVVPEQFDEDLERFFRITGIYAEGKDPGPYGFSNPFFDQIAIPMFLSYKAYRMTFAETAVAVIREKMPKYSDWRHACLQWYGRRLKRDLGA